MKLEHAINLGYQRILNFEVRGGGFEWYGRSPANTLLTAYGIMLLDDMHRVYPIDRSIIKRAVSLLRARQRRDGSWGKGRALRKWPRLKNSGLPYTAYIAWAMLEAGYNPGWAIEFIENRVLEENDPYVLGLCANALVLAKSPLADKVLDKLEALAVKEDDAVFWRSQTMGVMYASGRMIDIETTALATLALGRAKRPTAYMSIKHIVGAKEAYGAWYSTQATILCLKALLEVRAVAEDTSVKLYVNHAEIKDAFFKITRANCDTVQFFDLTKYIAKGENLIKLVSDKKTAITYQVCAKYYIPWQLVKKVETPVKISIKYDKTKLRVNDEVKVEAEVRYDGKSSFMLIVDLGIPPGFVVDTDSLNILVKQKKIDRFTLTGRQITIYFGEVKRGMKQVLKYRLKAKYPLKVRTPVSSAWEYYTPQNSAVFVAPNLEVTE
jgi:hypothetical protein